MRRNRRGHDKMAKKKKTLFDAMRFNRMEWCEAFPDERYNIFDLSTSMNLKTMFRDHPKLINRYLC